MPSALIKDIYRMKVSRCGIIDKGSIGYSDENFKTAYVAPTGRFAYFEFDPTLELTAKNTPDTIESIDGMRVLEVDVHIWARTMTKNSGGVYYNYFDPDLLFTPKIGAHLPINWEMYAINGREYSSMRAKNRVSTGVREEPINFIDAFFRISTSTAIDARYKDVFDRLRENTAVVWLPTGPGTIDPADEDPNNNLEMICGTAVASDPAWAAYTPYCEVTFGTVIPFVDDYSPRTGEYVNPRSPQKLQWSFSYLTDSVIGTVKCGRSVVEIRKSGTYEAETFEVGGSTFSLDIPEKYLESDFEWRVMVESVHGMMSDYCEWQACTVTDSLSKPVILYPANTYVNSTQAQTFSWQHQISTNTQPTGFHIQFYKGSAWVDIVNNAESSASIYVVEAGVLNNDVQKWRVRTYNADGVPGDWSNEVGLIVQVPSAVRNLTATGRSMPVLSWETTDQQGYRVWLNNEPMDSNYGAENAYAFKDILADGEYTIGVQVVNSYGMWGNISTITHTVRNRQGVPAEVTAQARLFDIVLEWRLSVGVKYWLYRDGTLLSRDATSPFTDHTAYGRHKYTVRAVDEGGNYTDCPAVYSAVHMRNAAMCARGKWEWVPLVFGETLPTRSTDISPVYQMNYYSGRTKPVIEMSIHKAISHAVAYTVFSLKDINSLSDMVGKNVCFKRWPNELIEGVLTSFAVTRSGDGYAFSATINEVDDNA